MTCDDFAPFIGTYVDAEFDERERADMEAHLALCASCRCQVEKQFAFKEDFRACLSVSRAPETLRLRIVQELECLELPECGKRAYGAHLLKYGWIAAPVAAAVAVAVVLPSFTVATASSSQSPMIEQTVDWHLGNYPLEVTSSNPTEITNWFRGKVDFSVRLPHFPEGRVNLLGGRIAHIQDRRAAYVLYEVDGTKLSVLLFHGEGLKVPSESIRTLGDRDVVLLNNKGYGIALLQDHGVTYTMTSEMAGDQLASLVAESLE